ncbi:MAG: hypothetical protein Kow009_08590 [Spirochaetales bacterium]
MSPRNRRRRKSSSNSRNGHGVQQSISFQKPQVEPVVCPRCNAPIKNVYLSLVDPATGQAVHFDCALQIVRQRETLGKGETLVYMGSGNFAIVDRAPGSGPFHIRKIIPFEERESAASWRKLISYSL